MSSARLTGMSKATVAGLVALVMLAVCIAAAASALVGSSVTESSLTEIADVDPGLMNHHFWDDKPGLT